MKIQIFRRMIMLSVLVVLTTVSANAQAGKQFTVTIPFDFYIGGKSFTAGQYHVGRSTQASTEGLVLRGTDGRAGVFVLTRGIQNEDVQKQSKVVFHRYGNQYFLAEVWVSGRSTGRGLPTSRKERAVAREIAKQGANPETVAVSGDKQ